MSELISLRLEEYTLKRRKEVLIVNLETASGQPDMVMIYGGFSSSLMHGTAFDPDIPIIAPDSKIVSIDRVASPYEPNNPEYIEEGLTLAAMEEILAEMNL